MKATLDFVPEVGPMFPHIRKSTFSRLALLTDADILAKKFVEEG